MLIGAMGPPGGGRNMITSRFLRHFNVICTVEGSKNEMQRIFSKLMDWHYLNNKIPGFSHKSMN